MESASTYPLTKTVRVEFDTSELEAHIETLSEAEWALFLEKCSGDLSGLPFNLVWREDEMLAHVSSRVVVLLKPIDEPKEDEIEITPEMVRAGAKLLADNYEETLDWLTEEKARAVFEKMLSARAPPKDEGLVSRPRCAFEEGGS